MTNTLAYCPKKVSYKKGATTINIMTFIIMTLSIKCIFEALGINDIQHSSKSAIMLNVIMLSVTIYQYLC
jgi:hypothetical protein